MNQSDPIDQTPKAEAFAPAPIETPATADGPAPAGAEESPKSAAKRAPRPRRAAKPRDEQSVAASDDAATPVPDVSASAGDAVAVHEPAKKPARRTPRAPRSGASGEPIPVDSRQAGQVAQPQLFEQAEQGESQPVNLAGNPPENPDGSQQDHGETRPPRGERPARGARRERGPRPDGSPRQEGGPRPEGGRGPRGEGRGPRPEGGRGPRPDGTPARYSDNDPSMLQPVSAEADAEPLPSLTIDAPLGLGLDPSQKRGRNEPSEFDEKLHKVLADAGIGSRREMEELIQAGRISVNGKPAHTGQRVGPVDQIRVNGRTLKRQKVALPPQVLLYHKPSNEICTRDDPQHRSTVFDRLPRLKGARWVAIGRLDFNTEGLLVFTTSGDLANKLMHPRYGWEREYAVRVLGRIDEVARQRLLDGIQLEDGIAKVNSISELGGEAANAWYKVTISEGRNREVRRLMEAVGVIVSRLVRVRFGPIGLPHGLARTRWIELSPGDVGELQRLVRKQVLISEGKDPAEVEAALAASGGGRSRHDDDEDDENDFGGPRADAHDHFGEEFYDHDPIPAYVDAGVVDDTVPDLVGEQAEDDWQPRSANAHLEGISRAVRKGDKSKAGAKGTGKPVRGRGGFGGGAFAGPAGGGPRGPGGFGGTEGAGQGRGGFKSRGRTAGGAAAGGRSWGAGNGGAAGGAWTGGPMGPAGAPRQGERPAGGRPGRGPRPQGQGQGGPGNFGQGNGQGGQGGQGNFGQGQGGQGQGVGGPGGKRRGGGQGGQSGQGAGQGQGRGGPRRGPGGPMGPNGPVNVQGGPQPAGGGAGNAGRNKARRPRRGAGRGGADGQAGGAVSGGNVGSTPPDRSENS